MRTEDPFSAPRGAALDPPEGNYVRGGSRQSAAASRRDFGDDFASSLPDSSGDDGPEDRSRKSSYRLLLSGRALQVPKTTGGRILSAIAFLIFLGVCGMALAAVRSFFLHDPRFTVTSSSEIQTTGNAHLSRAQLLSVFGEDVERNIFKIPLSARRTELESLPWVQQATVMRLLPNHIRIAVIERTPIAFVRQGSQIGMVDVSGVLLDMPSNAPGDPHYSFPVVTGVTASESPSIRAARMKIYATFTSDLDSAGKGISRRLSEVDLSNPEDVKALIPEANAGITTDILVHFGDTDFLARYQKFEDHLREWLTDHPKLASVDMRYERQVVLEMQPGAESALAPVKPTATPQPKAVAAPPAAAPPVAKLASKPDTQPGVSAARKPSATVPLSPAVPPAAKPVQVAKTPAPARPAASTAARPVQAAKAPAPGQPASEEWHMVVVKPHTKEAADLAKARLAALQKGNPQ